MNPDRPDLNQFTEPHWVFAKPGKTQRQRNSTLQEHFANSGSDRAGDLVREGTQNAGDARRNGKPVRIRIAFGELAAARVPAYLSGLVEHAPDIAKQKGMSAIKSLSETEPCPFLAFEDFNTTGLTGDPKKQRRYEDEPPNAFHTFFRAEGQTDKADDRKQGSKGVGKVTFMAPSLPRAVFGLTTRFDDNRTLFFGTSVLHTHRHDGEDYEGDAWFGRGQDDEILPVEDSHTVEQFRKDFSLARQPGEPGFSVVVPWLNNDAEDGITPEKVIQAVLRDQSWPILQNKIVVEVVTVDGTITTIDSAHFLDVLDQQPDAFRAQLRPMAELANWAVSHPPSTPADRLGMHKNTAPAWSDPNLLEPSQRDRLRDELEAGKPVGVRVPIRIKPKGQTAVDSYFDVVLQREPVASAIAGPTVHFFRADLLISGMSRRSPGTRALILIEDKGLGGFLRDSENPSHTKWASKAIKDAYTYAPGTLAYVVEAAKHLATMLAGDPAEKDASIWADELSLPAGDEIEGAGGKGKKMKKPKAKTESGEPPSPPPPPPPKRPYEIVAHSGGFTVKPSGRPFPAPLPMKLELQLAYHVRGKNPLAHFSPSDFDLTRPAEYPCTVSGCAIEECQPGRLVLRVDQPDFKCRIDGFDARRELFCKPRLISPVAEVSETGEESVAAAGNGPAADNQRVSQIVATDTVSLGARNPNGGAL